ncbi:MAG: substrate-binding domain-containing protein [Planktomarina sp.]|nr:substrate-binding domain-containing protein [Planktomarina sp.]MDV3050118.1 substrate-binding domain-containing protein [Planktomarina sp.]
MNFKKLLKYLIVFGVVAGGALARDNVQVAGSSTVLPYAAIVAEAFGENYDFPTPVVESGGSSAGLKRFCQGVGTNTIDVANSSRKIKDKEIKACNEAGVTEIIEVRIGYDGIVFASDIQGNSFEFTQTDWYLALSDTILSDGKMVPNPHKNWSDVNSSMPAQPIQAFVPGTKHGTREVFEDKVILKGCEATGAFEVLKTENGGDKKKAEKACIALRTDGVSVDIDGDYTETLARIEANSDGIGVFGLAFYENNTNKLQVATMANVLPSVESISTGEYPVSRPLYFYIKAAHIGVVPGVKEYAEFFISDDIAGPDGPLAEYGLVSDPALEETQEIVNSESNM